MISETISAKGHRNVTAKHKTTFQITKDKEISKRADCVVGVSADKALSDFKEVTKAALRNDGSKVRLLLYAGETCEVVTGLGSTELKYSDNRDMVVRKSSFTSGRTLMIRADKAAADLDRRMIERLKRSENITIIVQVYF
jgi:hypothetical protein